MSIALGASSAYFAVGSGKVLATNDARAARQSIVQNVLRMSELQAAGGVGRQNEILLLAAESNQLVDEFGQDRLNLSPTLYRQVAQYVAWSTTDLDLATSMADSAITYSDATSVERVHAYRVLGDIAAQEHDPQRFEDSFDKALDQTTRLRSPDADVDTYTRVYRLAYAYMGADRALDPETGRAFCDRAIRWNEDLTSVQDWQTRPLVRQALQHALSLGVGAEPSTADLVAVCA